MKLNELPKELNSLMLEFIKEKGLIKRSHISDICPYEIMPFSPIMWRILDECSTFEKALGSFSIEVISLLEDVFPGLTNSTDTGELIIVNLNNKKPFAKKKYFCYTKQGHKIVMYWNNNIGEWKNIKSFLIKKYKYVAK